MVKFHFVIFAHNCNSLHHDGSEMVEYVNKLYVEVVLDNYMAAESI